MTDRLLTLAEADWLYALAGPEKGDAVKLLTAKELERLPQGTALRSIGGQRAVKGLDVL